MSAATSPGTGLAYGLQRVCASYCQKLVTAVSGGAFD